MSSERSMPAQMLLRQVRPVFEYTY